MTPIRSAVAPPSPALSPRRPLPPGEPSEVFYLHDPRELGALRAEWLRLAAELPGSSYFQTPDWVLGWWETIGGRPPTVVATWRGASDALEAICLLSRVRQPLHPRNPLTVSAWVNTGSEPGAADHGGWLARPERSASVAEWTLRHASDASLLLHSIDPDIGHHLPRRARAVWRTCCPRILIPADAGAVGRSARFRQQLRTRERKLRGAGVTLRWVDPEEMSDDVLQALSSLHRDRWRARGGRDLFTPDQIHLHRRLVETSAPGRGPAAVVAEHEGRCIAVLYGLWWKEVFAYYQMGWNPAWESYSVGTVLLREAIRMAGARGGQVFDFLRGTEPLKYRFGAYDRTDTTWLVPRGWSGRVLGLGFATRELVRSLRGGPPAGDGPDQARARP